MIFWIDAQLSPSLAPWLAERFGVQAFSVKYLGHRDASDREIFEAARQANAAVITKDMDFVRLLERFGPPPQILLVALGNTSNARMKQVLEQTFSRAVTLLQSGEPFVEISPSP